MKVRSIILCIGVILCIVSCARMVRPTNLDRLIVETEIADLNTDFYPESIVVSSDVRHIAYIEDVYSGLRVVVDDNPQESYDDIARGMQFSPSNDYVAYFAYYEGYSGGILGLFATDPYWEVVVNNSVYGSYPDLLNNSLVLSPDGKHVAYGVLLSQYINSIYYDHKPLPSLLPAEWLMGDSLYVGDVFSPFVFSPDSKKFTYVAECEYEYNWFYSVIVNNNPGKAYNYIYPQSLLFSPSREKFAYVVQNPKDEKVIVNEAELAPYESIGESTLRFSPDSEHLAYAACENEDWFIVRDEIKSLPYYDIGQIVFSPDSKHLAYTAEENGDWIVFKDKKEIARHSAIVETSLTFSPDSRHIVYAVAADSGIAVYEDDNQIGIYEAIVTPPIYSSDGKFLVYTIEDNKTQAVVVNGNKGKPYPAIISHNGGRIVFDDNNSIHYLAVKDDDKVYLVEESF